MSCVRATDNHVPLSVYNIVEILVKLKKAKAPGLDNLHTEHFTPVRNCVSCCVCSFPLYLVMDTSLLVQWINEYLSLTYD